MKYRPDPDLDFLKDCTSEDLDILVRVLLHDKDGKPRSIVQLPNHSLYKQFAPQHASYWEVIAGEIQRYGSNPLAALARAGRGKHYIKILDNVCSRFSVRYLTDAAVEIIERELCMTLFTRALQHVPTKELQTVCLAFRITPATLTPYGITLSVLETMRLNDQATCLLHMIIAHGAAMHASNVSYAPLAPEHAVDALALFEKPLEAELSPVCSLSMTGAAHWIIVPTILQLAYIRAAKNAD
jgi:uncharacterized protein YaaW (UPF0174 family)